MWKLLMRRTVDEEVNQNDFNDQDDAQTSDGLTHVLQAHYFAIEAALIYNTTFMH